MPPALDTNRRAVTSVQPVAVGSFAIGGGHPLAFILGPCVIESAAHALEHGDGDPRHRRPLRRAGRLQGVVRQGQPHVAHLVPRPRPRRRDCRRSPTSRRSTGLPILTDIHEAGAGGAGRARSPTSCRFPRSSRARPTCSSPPPAPARVVNVKKGQFLAPRDMRHVIAKVAGEGNAVGAGHRARRQLRLQQPGRRHARLPDAARARLPRRLRRHAQPAAARRRRRRHRRPGRVHRAAGRRPASPPASTPSSWKCTRSRRGPGATPPTRCGSISSSR